MAQGRLDGRVAIVTGASRRGNIGAAVCRALASRGADVLFTHWRPFDREMSWGSDEDAPPPSRKSCVGWVSAPKSWRLTSRFQTLTSRCWTRRGSGWGLPRSS